MRALLLLVLLAACTEAPASVGTYSTTIECGWDAREGRYQDHIIYRDQHGRAVGQSDAAGECATPPAGASTSLRRQSSRSPAQH